MTFVETAGAALAGKLGGKAVVADQSSKASGIAALAGRLGMNGNLSDRNPRRSWTRATTY